jgi:hypothetical protein
VGGVHAAHSRQKSQVMLERIEEINRVLFHRYWTIESWFDTLLASWYDDYC